MVLMIKTQNKLQEMVFVQLSKCIRLSSSSSSSRAVRVNHHDSLSLSLSISPYHPLLPANYILCPHRADVNMFLLVG